MSKTVIGLYDDYAKAETVLEDLVETGFDGDAISTITEANWGKYFSTSRGNHGPITSTEHGATAMSAPVDNLVEALEDFGMLPRKAAYYAEAVKRGGTLLVVTVHNDDETQKAAQIIDSHGSIDINNRSAKWRQSGWADPYADEDDADVMLVETTYVLIVPENRRLAS